jgi:hypothetical protein
MAGSVIFHRNTAKRNGFHVKRLVGVGVDISVVLLVLEVVFEVGVG